MPDPSSTPQMPNELIHKILSILAPETELCLFSPNGESPSDRLGPLISCLRVNRIWHEISSIMIYSQADYTQRNCRRSHIKWPIVQSFDDHTDRQDRSQPEYKMIKSTLSNLQDLAGRVLQNSSFPPCFIKHIAMTNPRYSHPDDYDRFENELPWFNILDCERLSIKRMPRGNDHESSYPPPLASLKSCIINYISESDNAPGLFHQDDRDRYPPQFRSMTILFNVPFDQPTARLMSVFPEDIPGRLGECFANAVIRSPEQVVWTFVNCDHMLRDRDLQGPDAIKRAIKRLLRAIYSSRLDDIVIVTTREGVKVQYRDIMVEGGSENSVTLSKSRIPNRTVEDIMKPGRTLDEEIERTLNRVECKSFKEWIETGEWKGIFTREQAETLLKTEEDRDSRRRWARCAYSASRYVD